MTFNHKNIPINDRLIVALDVPHESDAIDLIEKLGDHVGFYKIGLELFMAGSAFKLIEILKAKNKRIFVDLKFFDIPRTVGAAVKQLSQLNIDLATIHGNDSILQAANNNKGNTKILAVTALTSLDENDMLDLGFQCDIKNLVLSRALRALNLGCDGVVSSGLEVPELRNHVNHELIIVTPGIRPVKNTEDDDQKRSVDIKQAFQNGSDYIVMGRPIIKASNPVDSAINVQKLICQFFSP